MSMALVRPDLPTTSDRDRVVDLVRVLALAGVVVGHWLKQGWYVDDGDVLHRAGLLGIAPWTHPLTWVLQVIPIFFIMRRAAPESGAGTSGPAVRAL